MKTQLLACALFLLATMPAVAQFQGLMPSNPQDPNDPQATPSVALTLAPAAEPRPALQYQLLPTAAERTPGNAAPFYYRAILHQRRLPDAVRKNGEDWNRWMELPLAELPKDEIRTFLDAHRQVLHELQIAAYRERCDFDLRLQELRGMEIITFLLDEFQEMRQLGRVLKVKARLEIAEGQLDEAFQTLRVGYQLARDCAQPPLLVCSLVGIAIESTMNEQLRELIDAPGSPNLYWALAALPQPLIEMRPAMEFEMGMPLQMFPFLKDAETAERTPEQWQKLIVEATAELLQVDDQGPAPGPKDSWQAQLATTAMIAKAYPIAKQNLVAAGFSAERVEKMPVGQVIAIQSARAYRYAYHEMFKWILLPSAEGKPLLLQAEERLKAEGYLGHAFSGQEGLPLARLLLPAISSVQFAAIRSQRDFAALMNIEAIRMHAAATGKLPQSLDEIKVVPVPKNPATGLPFVYLVEGEQVTLGVPPVGHPLRGCWYVIRLDKAKSGERGASAP